jgi:hypothetical protein
MQSISSSKPQYARVQGYFQWSRRLRCGSAVDRFLGLGFEFHLGHGCLSVCCDCYVLQGKVLCDEVIIHPEDSTDCSASLSVI